MTTFMIKLLAEVEALPERKRKQWKSSLLDEQGARSRLIYRDGKLLNYSLIVALGSGCVALVACSRPLGFVEHVVGVIQA